MRKYLLPALVFITLFIGTSLFSIARSQTVSANIVTDLSDINNQNSFALGVLFEIKPGWHIYWQNPGDSGLPTRINFDLPGNFKQGETIWPVPEKIERSGNIVDYGYENKVLLWKIIKLPEGYNGPKSVPIKANINWVSCKDVCTPGNTTLETNIDISSPGSNNNRELFDKWKQLVPKKINNDFSYQTKSTSTDGNNTNFTVNLDLENLYPDKLEWFPKPGSELKVSNVSNEIIDGGQRARIHFSASLYPGKMLSSPYMGSVLVIKNSQGEIKSYAMNVEVIEVLRKQTSQPTDSTQSNRE